MPVLDVTPETITVDGGPALIQAALLRYDGLPHPDLWRGVLERLRMGGFNAVVIPFPWVYHSPGAGTYDFTGPRDLSRLLHEVARAGLWVVAHLGPRIDDDLDGGGLPVWLRDLAGSSALCDGRSAGPPPDLLLHLSEWWDHLLTFLRGPSNVIAVAIDPGYCTGARRPLGWTPALVELLRSRGVREVIALPEDVAHLAGDDRILAIASSEETAGGAVREDGISTLTWVTLPPSLAERGRATQARHAMLRPFARGGVAAALAPAHGGARWGWWAGGGAEPAAGERAPVGEGGALSETYYHVRRMALSLEMLGPSLTGSVPAPQVRSEPGERLLGARQGWAGTVACLQAGPREMDLTALELTDGGDTTVEDIALDVGDVAMLPIHWRLAGTRLATTNLEPLLHMVVAGRELLVVRNIAGGELLLPGDLRPRHQRGAVVVERLSSGWMIHFDPGKVGSAVLDSEQGPIQLLALASPLAERVWPLDDQWRTTPHAPAAWHPAAEEPARGLIIGPELVLPREDGGYRYLVGEKGLGYRWGPWRGSDPHTWLSPLMWSASPPVSLPRLVWDSRPGAPEALSDYDDRAWRVVPTGGQLAMDDQGIRAGFAWYRARLEGAPTSVTVVCRGACDLFLNGAHFASLNPPPGGGPVTPKTLPLPQRHLRVGNVLAILVEAHGRPAAWDLATEARGLIACDLEGGRIAGWAVRAGLVGERQRQGFYGYADWALVDGTGAEDVTWHHCRFDLQLPPDIEAPVYLALDPLPTKSYIYLNGVLIGRQAPPHLYRRRVWLPDGVLRRRGDNELMVAQWTRGGEPGIGRAHLEAGTALQWHEQEAR